MAAIELIAKEIFDKDGDRITIHRCETGDVNTSYIASAGEKRVFIIIQDKDALPSFYVGQIEREVAGLKICRGNNIPCPSIVKFDYELKYIATEYIEYPLLSQLWG